MRRAGVAVVFLTRLRLPVGVSGADDIAGSVSWFPVVGAAVGTIVGLIAAATSRVVPAGVAAAIAVGVGLLVTGAFHEDGLADTFDGLAGGMDRQSRLEIMKDSRVGTFGASALVVALVARIGVIAALVDGEWWWPAAVLAAGGALSRAAAVVVMRLGSPIGGGLGASQMESVSTLQVVVAVAVSLAIGSSTGPGAAAGVVAAAVAALFVAGWSHRAIGGVTGDVLGAVQVISELAFLIALLGADLPW